MSEKEVRQLTTDFQVRSMDVEGTDKTVIEGYALKFNTWSNTLGGYFKETISSDALRNADMSNVVALFNHSGDKVLGRSGVNLDLEVDDIGLRFKVTPANTSYGNDLIENMKSGIINQCSFAMSEIESDWSDSPDSRGIHERTIRSIGKIWDVSVVTSPAYDDTTAVIGARSIEMVEKLKERDNRKEELRKSILESSIDNL